MKIIGEILAIILAFVSFYSFETADDYKIMRYLPLLLTMILSVGGIIEFQKKRKGYAILCFLAAGLGAIVSFDILFS